MEAALGAEAAEQVENYANGLLSLGVRKGDAFAIIGSNRVEWALFDFALGSIGAIGAAIYANSSPSDAGYILEHSEAIGVLCEDEAQRAKVESVRGAAPRLEHVLTYADLDDLAARGRARGRAPERAPRGRGAGRGGRSLHLHLHIRHDRAAEGVHDLAPQLLRDGRSRRRPAELHRPGRRDALYLPLAHNFGRLMHLSGAYVGYAIAFLADPFRPLAALPAVKPTVFPSVPRVYESTPPSSPSSTPRPARSGS